MNYKTFFDHLEVHVQDIPKYCNLLLKIFEGGVSKVINENGTIMFKSPEGLFIEIKKKLSSQEPIQNGFCQPCLRRINAKQFIEQKLNFIIIEQAQNEIGNIYFFKDHENITWHIKDYLERASNTDW